MKILLAQLNPTVGDIFGNQQKILKAIDAAQKAQCDMMVTSELALLGYPPEDLLLLSQFVTQAEEALKPIIEASKKIVVIVGTIRQNPNPAGKPLFNSAAVCVNGNLVGYQDKMLLPTYDVFSERRYFEAAAGNKAWKIHGHQIGITICEDIWQHSGSLRNGYLHDPVKLLSSHELDVMVNLSASPFHVGKFPNRLQTCQIAAKSLRCPVLLCNEVGGNDSLIFDGKSLAVNAKGQLIALAKGFEEDYLIIDTEAKKEITFQEQPIDDLYRALVMGLRDYFVKSGFKKACIGLSGGIDSALVACIAKDALGSENLLGVAMPSRYSAKDSVKDAEDLARNLKIPLKVIPIEKPFQAYLELLTPEFEGKAPDTTEENLQARIRGMILMALSNKLNMIVLSTGNKSELAMGYATLYGDMCGGLAVINDLTKEQVYALSRFINQKNPVIPESTLTKAPSAELKPDQKDTDTLPPYPIVDAVLEDYIVKGNTPAQIAEDHKIPLEQIKDLVLRIHRNEYKRRQSAPGLRVTEKAFSIGRRFPIVQRFIQ